ncbi:MAG: DUF1566 domain-containing protein [Deltaproteobacteria bacterium]|nr:DUF1566 domain-containing protein [Deltaproteobacteria bacterium]
MKDTVTGLEWQRCSVGQTWNAETKHCDGSVIGYNWFGAQGLTKAGGFRLPTITELRSLVYCSSGIPITIGMTLDGVGCSEPSGPTFTRPTIVTAAFPDVPLTSTVRSHYWTSSTSADDPNRGRGVSFYRGNASSGPKDTPGLSARLVRTGN